MKMNEDYDMLSELKNFEAPKDEINNSTHKKQEYTVFDFINEASQGKRDLIRKNDYPEHIEKLYNPYIANRGFSFHLDTIIYANEMNMRPSLFKGAQFDYYLHSLPPKKRYSKWHKLEKDDALDTIQQYYQCNRQIAKQYLSVLSKETVGFINKLVSKGGASK